MTPNLPPARTIADERELRQLARSLADEKRIACDTESNSLHAYRGVTCLIQISTPAADYLVDPLAIADISALGSVFADPGIEKIFHAAEFDLICLKRDFDFDVRPVFDTMAAARVCGFTRIGLSHLLDELLGVAHAKRYQKADWGKRPLPASQLQYAQMDTHFLLRLRAALHDRLRELDRLEEAREYFDDVTRFELKTQEFDPDGFWDVCRRAALKPRQLAILRELYILRDELARAHDHPPPRLIPNKALLTMATSPPKRVKQLFGIAGLPAWLARQSGGEILEAIAHGGHSLPPTPPPRVEPTPQPIVDRYNALHNWRKKKASQRGVESDVIISKGALWQIAASQPASVDELAAITGVGPWRRKTYGPDLVAIGRGRRRK